MLTAVCGIPIPAAAAGTAPDLTGMTSFTFDGDSVVVAEGDDTNYEVVVYDATDTESAAETSTDADGNTVYSVPEGSDGELLVSVKKAGGSYVFQGSGNGSIAVKKEAKSDAVLYLNGLTLTSSFTSVITVKKDSTAACTIYAVDGTTSTLTDNAYNNDESYTDNAAAENAVIKCKDGSDVTITGGGTLNLSANGKNGIKANDLLTIDTLTLNITAVDNGISGENSITINSGTLHISTAEGDGIKACADAEAVGSVTVTGGSITIDACADGIQAMMTLTITGGTFDITTYGGYDADYDGDDDSYPSAKGLKASGSYEDTDGTEIDATGNVLTVTGGTFVLNTADDAVHTDGDLTITGGDFSIRTGDDALHASGILTLGAGSGSDLSVSVAACYEGLEGATVDVYSGTFEIYSYDDSINAANSDLTGYSFEINIFGGSVYAAAETGDCLDSNGNINISGGTVVVLGALDNTKEVNAALDCDGTLTVTGGTLLAVGMQEMSVTPGSASTQPYVTWTEEGSSIAVNGGSGSGGFWSTTADTSDTYTASAFGPPSGGGTPGNPGQGGSTSGFVSNGDVLTIYDADNNKLFSAAAVWSSSAEYAVNYVLYSAADLTAGSSYTLVIGDDGTDTECWHNYVGVVSSPTCTEQGYTTYTCTLCGDSYVSDYTDALGHVWDEGTETTKATCTEDGVMTYTCTTCKVSYTVTIPAMGHIYEDGHCIYCGDAEEGALSAPALTGAANDKNGVTVTWEAVEGAEQYVVLRRNATTTPWTAWEVIATVSDTSYTDTDVVTGQLYRYTVACANADGERVSDYNTSGVAVRWVAPTTLKASNGSVGIVLTWTEVENADGYIVSRKTSGGEYKWVATLTGSDTLTYTDKNAAGGASYTYKVEAYSGNTRSAFTAVGLYRLEEVTLTAENQPGKIVLTWTESAGATGYYVYRRTTDGAFEKIATVSDADTLTYTDTEVASSSGTGYYYAVRAYKGYSASSYTAVKIVRLGHPTLTLTKTDSGIQLSWTKSNNCTSYVIYRVESDGSLTQIAKVSSSTLTYTDKTVKSGTKYTYAVRAYRDGSYSSYTAKSLTY
ncbi:MAG: carbohydrate-binding domain-containing protein [Clostridiales bacterium]|nr:carbohydrate-binding domain-containing protein [Clostridiales bacterium]